MYLPDERSEMATEIVRLTAERDAARNEADKALRDLDAARADAAAGWAHATRLAIQLSDQRRADQSAADRAAMADYHAAAVRRSHEGDQA